MFDGQSWGRDFPQEKVSGSVFVYQPYYTGACLNRHSCLAPTIVVVRGRGLCRSNMVAQHEEEE